MTVATIPTRVCSVWKTNSARSVCFPDRMSASFSFHISLTIFSVSRLLICLLRTYGRARGLSSGGPPRGHGQAACGRRSPCRCSERALARRGRSPCP